MHTQSENIVQDFINSWSLTEANLCPNPLSFFSVELLMGYSCSYMAHVSDETAWLDLSNEASCVFVLAGK